MDFVADSLFNGKRIRTLTVMDNFGSEPMAIQFDYSIQGDHVAGDIDAMQPPHDRCPNRIQVYICSKFNSKVFDKREYENDVVLDLSRLASHTDDSFVESRNRSFPDECVNSHRCLSRKDT